MAAIAISSAGVKLSYAPEATAGTRPTTAYVHVEGIISIPSLDSDPSTLETTTLDNLTHKTYIAGLKDTGGVLAFEANYTEALKLAWNGNGTTTGLMGIYAVAAAAAKSVWLCVDIPGIANSIFFTVEPMTVMPGDIGTDGVIVCTPRIVITGEPVDAVDPSYATE